MSLLDQNTTRSLTLNRLMGSGSEKFSCWIKIPREGTPPRSKIFPKIRKRRSPTKWKTFQQWRILGRESMSNIVIYCWRMIPTYQQVCTPFRHIQHYYQLCLCTFPVFCYFELRLKFWSYFEMSSKCFIITGPKRQGSDWIRKFSAFPFQTMYFLLLSQPRYFSAISPAFSYPAKCLVLKRNAVGVPELHIRNSAPPRLAADATFSCATPPCSSQLLAI